jgi:ABC-type nickel/cobalt efflux system permease component RcnA
VVFSLLSMLLAVNVVFAHPLGNFSISHYSGINIGKDAIEVRYIIDMAEIPTFQEIQETGITAKIEDPNVQAYLARKAEAFRDGLLLELNGQRLTLQVESGEIIFPPGAGSLPTMKIGVVYRAKLSGNPTGGPYSLTYRDGNFPGRAGWKEIIAVAESGAKILNSSVPETDRSSQLSNYPTDLLDTPPQQLEARVMFTSLPAPTPLASVGASLAASGETQRTSETARSQAMGSHSEQFATETITKKHSVEPPVSVSVTKSVGRNDRTDSATPQLAANSQTTPRNSFTELMATKQLGMGIIVIALAVAVGLGAFHALEPGHGKTLVAAYLVGSRGTFKHALLLGLIVTAAHTAGVYLLGAVTLYASQYVVPERLYPWLGVVSGVMITGLGSLLLARRYRGKEGILAHQHHDAHHSHESGHHHDHANYGHSDSHGHGHHHGHSHHHHEPGRATSLKELVTLGISGGIVPCPAALVVLLSAVSMDRVAFGLLLIVAFSAGLAAVLIGIGLLMVCAGQFMSRFHTEGRLVTRWLPLTSSAFILLFGIALTIQALQGAGIVQIQL